MSRKRAILRSSTVEKLEERTCLASSVGWDGAGLGSATLTYHISNLPSSLNSAQVESAIVAALNAWSSAASISFTETPLAGLADSIDISFRAIDGPGGVLAEGYMPDDVNRGRIAGDVQFDSSEIWEVGNAMGSAAVDLVSVAVHEIGHALGLDHSSAPGSVMADSISSTGTFNGPAAADVAAIQALYAPASGTTTSTPATPTSATPTASTPTATASDDVPAPAAPPTGPRSRFRRGWRARVARRLAG